MPRAYNLRSYRRNRALMLSVNPTCTYPGCNAPATTADHIIPISKGGDSSLTNLRPMCLHHNSARGNKTKTHYQAPY